VCRSTGAVSRRLLVDGAHEIALLIQDDIDQLIAGEVKPTRGDIRCLIFGHLIRLTIWSLRQSWDKQKPVADKLSAVADHINAMGGAEGVERFIVYRGSNDPEGRYKVMVKSAKNIAQFSS
jgi:putative DNA methylase